MGMGYFGSVGFMLAQVLLGLLLLLPVLRVILPLSRVRFGNPVCQAVYREQFGAESTVQVIHAGLECGIIAAKYPGIDIVSFGPTIRGAHAPGESVEVASVARTWQLLTAILAQLAQPQSAQRQPARPA